MSSRWLLVLPDDSAIAVLEAIEKASQSLRVKMFAFSNPVLLEAVIGARRRGVKVQAILNAARRDGEEQNGDARSALIREGIEVRDGNPAFALTHEKSMVVDDETAFVQSFNWTLKNLTESRDYAVVTSRPREVREIVEGFEADWRRQRFSPSEGSRLVWSPGARDRIAELIDDARHSLFLQNERYQDPIIVERLVRAANRGVKIRVMARPPHTLKPGKLVEAVSGLRILDDIGIKVHSLKRYKLHGKVLLADGVAAIVGSTNLTPGSLDDRRELSIVVREAAVVERLHDVVHEDWESSYRLDLSDNGLLADLEDRAEAAAKLGIRDDREHDERAA